jgi:hypothetical protein
MTFFKDALRSSVAHPRPNPRVDAIDFLLALAQADPTVSAATLILPDGTVTFLDTAALRRGGQA